MPTTPRPAPRVDPELLNPIDGIPDKMNDFLIALASGLTGQIQPSATQLQTSTTQISRWREKNKEFDKRINEIQAQLAQSMVDRLETRALQFALGEIKKKKKMTRRNADDEIVETMEYEEEDMNMLVKTLEALAQARWGKGQKQLDENGPTQFTFKLGNELEAGPEAGEIIDEDPPDE